MKDLKQLHAQFMEEQEFSAKLRPETLRGYVAGFNLLMKIIPDIRPDMLTQDMMTEFFRRLEKRERVVGRGIVKKGIKASTVATYRSKLNKFFEWLAYKEVISGNPFTHMDYPEVEYGDRKFLPKEKVEKLFNLLAFSIEWENNFVHKRNMAIFSTLLYTGMRRGEFLGLQMRDIDFTRKEILIRAATSKSKRDRVVPISSQLIRALEDYFSERTKRGYMCNQVFVSNNADKPITKNGLKHMVHKITKRVGFKFHLHQFRHTYAVNLLNVGADVAKVKQLLGHTDIRMTAVYLRCLPTAAMRVDVEKLSLDNLV